MESYNSYYYDNEYLKHYGVLGMKWGIRRARAKGTTYSYKSRTTKKYEKKAAKAAEAGDKEAAKNFKKVAKRSADLDKKMETSVRKSTAGKTAAKILLNGIFAAKTYEVAKAAGYGRAGAEGVAVVSSYLAGPLGNMAANALIRSDYIHKD